MRDEELRRILHEIDTALEIIRKERGREFDATDAEIQAKVSELRRELAVYRAVLQARPRLKSI